VTRQKRNELLVEHRAIVSTVAARLRMHAPRQWGDDLYGWGILAMVKALDGYQPSRSKNLIAYLACKVRFGIFDALRDVDKSRRRGQPPEFADLDQVRLADKTPNMERAILAREAWRIIGTLPERHRLMMRLYYLEERTMKECGSVMGISEGRVSQIHAAVVGRLRKALLRDLGKERR